MAKFGTRQHERSGGSSHEAFKQRDLYGRRQEQAALDRILDAARQGRGVTMVLWGDPGIGKTAPCWNTWLSPRRRTSPSCDAGALALGRG
ncbi:ATP-binding protein [Streptomyces sp. NPDC101152]|uniref:ATP-binding protein n=1 Tax=Streptomyces sp. NPDC101152 TaxID=3366116 RepID=UPI00380C7D44